MTRVRLLNLAIVAALVGLLIWQLDLGEMGDALAAADAPLIVIAVAINAPIGALYGLRSKLLLARLGHAMPDRLLFPTMLLGNVAGSMTPASSGELLRTAVLRTHAGIATEDGLALVLYERAVSVYLLTAGGGLGAIALALSGAKSVAVLAAAPAVLVLPPLLARAVPLPRFESRRHRLARLAGTLVESLERTRAMLRDGAGYAAWAAMTMGIFALVAAQFWLLARAIDSGVNPLEAWVAFAGSQAAAIASLLPLGIGAGDASLAGLMHRFGLTLEEGAAAAVLARLAIALPLGVAAIASYLYLARAAPDAVHSEAPAAKA
ncbi:MAG TPA: lysylphosphatidylglycerol synthase transmembrane domain-containing protein [Dehalococcoidia bacterium]|nr:lysylphosphatidylglycerol synthase transmembrane domain-containing protein [Dehalococcoidia bacterium]